MEKVTEALNGYMQKFVKLCDMVEGVAQNLAETINEGNGGSETPK
jgi:alpha-galactosidase/6-phospho-beta-glucosidase family protein